jgi:hypothetical protein
MIMKCLEIAQIEGGYPRLGSGFNVASVLLEGMDM